AGGASAGVPPARTAGVLPRGGLLRPRPPARAEAAHWPGEAGGRGGLPRGPPGQAAGLVGLAGRDGHPPAAGEGVGAAFVRELLRRGGGADALGGAGGGVNALLALPILPTTPGMLSELEILFEDNHCLAVAKPAGVPSTHYEGREETID